MNAIFKIGGLVGLLLTALGPILVFTGVIDVDRNKLVMLAGMVIWFLFGTPWLSARKLQPTDSQVEI